MALFVRMIQDLVSDVLVDVGALYKASEAVGSRRLFKYMMELMLTQIALLDMLWAFAHGAIRKSHPGILQSEDPVVNLLSFTVRNYGTYRLHFCWP